MQYLPLQFKLTATFLINSIVTVLLVLIPLIVQDQATAYWITISLAIVFGCSYAILQATLYGVAGPCAALTNNLMFGVGLSGLIINAIRMIFLASIKNLDLEAQLFFYGSALFLFVCTYLSFTFVRDFQHDEFSKKTQQSTSMSQRWHDTKLVYKVNWKEAWAVCLTYWVQFTFYPGVMLE